MLHSSLRSNSKQQLTLSASMTGFCLSMMLAFAPSAVFGHEEHGAHVHGQARMEVAVEGEGFSVHLESPLHDLVGFEHAPRTAKERAAVKAAVAQLRQPVQLILATTAARCQPDKTYLSSPVIQPAMLGETATTSPDGKAPDNDGHAELAADFTFHCADQKALRGIEFNLFKGFPSLRRINVQIAGPKGQSARTLTPASRQLDW